MRFPRQENWSGLPKALFSVSSPTVGNTLEEDSFFSSVSPLDCELLSGSFKPGISAHASCCYALEHSGECLKEPKNGPNPVHCLHLCARSAQQPVTLSVRGILAAIHSADEKTGLKEVMEL